MIDKKKVQVAEAMAVHAPGAITSVAHLPVERTGYRSLLLSNANHFGNLPDSFGKPTIKLVGNSTYERITCVGFQPKGQRVNAVVRLNQSAGYSGNICTAGSQEYVRFYLSLDNGATWLDQGVTSFTAHDIPLPATGAHPTYAVELPCAPPPKFCTIPNIVQVRAILSWSVAPPPDTPDFIPTWGNVRDVDVAVDPLELVLWLDLLEVAAIKLPVALAQVIDLSQPAQLNKKPTLSVKELEALYATHAVPPHRFAMAAIKKSVSASTFGLSPLNPQAAFTSGLAGIAIGEAIANIAATSGNTTFEELECVGLHPEGQSESLVAILTIKRPTGFSGGPCTEGSREYVTFWGDFNGNGTFETCLGTASVQVFDTEVPDGGLWYAVRLPVDLNAYRKACGAGPRFLPIRAVLSWNDVPDCGSPNTLPHWGNRIDSMIVIPPGGPLVGFQPFFYEVSNVPVCQIEAATGRASGYHPFGGSVCIAGDIPAALALNDPDKLQYRIWATNGSRTISIDESFGITLETGIGTGAAVSTSFLQEATDGWFTYKEYGVPTSSTSTWRRTSNRVLAVWRSPDEGGFWTLHIEARHVDAPATIYPAGSLACGLATISTVNVKLDQAWPVVSSLAIDTFEIGGVPAPAVTCGDIPKGALIRGSFTVTDDQGVGSVGFVVEPAGAATFVLDPGSTDTVWFGTWKVDTTTLEPCGYAVRLIVDDRTIYNCGNVHRTEKAVGFCLRK